MCISIGGTVSSAGVWGIASTVLAPPTVMVASGTVSHRLYSPFDNHPQFGLMLMQMMNDSTIPVEVFPGSTVTRGQFDTNASLFVR